ncbi:MAG: class I SAM-dependent rRNA methyltransferase [Runella sp.]
MNIKVYLKPQRDEAARRFHPWVFSGAIARIEGIPQDGDIVAVCDARGQTIALGHFHHGSIAVKIFAFEAVIPEGEFWFQKLKAAWQVRQNISSSQTNCYRLLHGEGDGMPGLIADYYNGVVVLQAHTIGMYRVLPDIVEALIRLSAEVNLPLRAIYQKSKETLPENFAQKVENGYWWGQAQVPHAVQENGHTFLVNWETGQKTGFFLDQRDNRALLARYAKGKHVLNAFCYSGGFSVYALAAGATAVDSVDVSQKAIALTQQNVAANFEQEVPHQAYTADVMEFLKNHNDTYDVIVLDPPAFAKSLSARHRAVQGYKRLNAEGIKHLKPNGILLTFSCSQVVDSQLFHNTIVAAAIEAGRKVRVLHQLTQGADHPVSLFHPEGSYLKGLVLWVE